MKRAAARAAGAPLRRPRVLPMSARESSGHVTLALVTCAVTLLVLVVGTHWQHQHPDDYFDEAVAAATREKTARLTNPQCRACETLLGAVEWHEPWWYESRAAWDWARSKSLPGVYDDEDYAEAYSLRMPRHPRSACGFHKMTPREARHVMRGRTVLFIGNSISRRLMYAVADAMGGERAKINALADGGDARYDAQRVWDTKENYHSFFEVPVLEGSGELGPQVTCVGDEGDEEGDAGDEEGDAGDGDESSSSSPSSSSSSSSSRSRVRFPDVDVSFGFDASANDGAGGVDANATARGGAPTCDRGAAAWASMRARHPKASSRLGFAFTNTPTTAVATALLRAWSDASSDEDFERHVGAHYDVVVVQIGYAPTKNGTDGAGVAGIAAAARAFAARRAASGRPVRLVFLGVPHSDDLGSADADEARVETWLRGDAWPKLRGDDGEGALVFVPTVDGDVNGDTPGDVNDSSPGDVNDPSPEDPPSRPPVAGPTYVADVVDITRATFRGVASGHVRHERSSGHHFTDAGRRLTAQLVLNRLAMAPCAPADAEDEPSSEDLGEDP